MKKILFFSQLAVGVLLLLGACFLGLDTEIDPFRPENGGNENENGENENEQKKTYVGIINIYSDEQFSRFVREYGTIDGELRLHDISTLVTESSLKVTGTLTIDNSRPLLTSLEGLTELLDGQSLHSLNLINLTGVEGGSLTRLKPPVASIETITILDVPLTSLDLEYFSRVSLGSSQERAHVSLTLTEIDSLRHWGFAQLLSSQIQIVAQSNSKIQSINAYCAIQDLWENGQVTDDTALFYYPDEFPPSEREVTLPDLQAAC